MQKNDSQRRKIKKSVLVAFRFFVFIASCCALLYGSEIIARIVCRLSPTSFLASLTPNGASKIHASAFLDDASAILGVLVVVLCIFKRRFYCRFLCPLGAALDACAFLRRKSFKKRFLKYGLTFPPRRLFAFFATFWALASIPFFLPDKTSSPLFDAFSPLIFDPTAIFSRAFVLFPKTSVVLIAFLVCFIVSPLFWRFQFCPCGTLQEALYLPKRLGVKIRQRNLATKKNAFDKKTSASSRRQFFGAASVISLSVVIVYALRRLGGKLSTLFFRPPGALPESRFLTQCARCGRCVDACPTKLLKLVDKEATTNADDPSTIANALQIGLPRVDFESGYCQEECVACGQVCPTGAIARLTPEKKARVPIGLAKFDLEKCLLYYNRECSICRRECSYDAISFVWSDEEYLKIPTIDEKLCVGCGRCVAFCPGEPLFDDSGAPVEDVSVKRPKALRIVKRA